MPSPEEYRARAKYFLEMASTADTWVANFLRLTAADYLELAHAAEKPKPVVLQQQQPQPNEPGGRVGGPPQLADFNISQGCTPPSLGIADRYGFGRDLVFPFGPSAADPASHQRGQFQGLRAG